MCKQQAMIIYLPRYTTVLHSRMNILTPSHNRPRFTDSPKILPRHPPSEQFVDVPSIRLFSNYGNISAPTPGLLARNSRIVKSKVTTLSPPSSSIGFVSSSIQGQQLGVWNLSKGSGGGALGTVCALPVSPETLRWIFVATATVLLFIKNVSIPKQFLVPLLALEIPRDALVWIKGDYGLWTAFLALAVKLFYHIPGELELPLYLLLIIITAPHHLTQYRGSTPSAVATLALAAYLGYEHFKASGTVRGAFENEKIFPSIAIIILMIIPVVYLVNGIY
ncbi:unnamed protein product [Calypogeia fissa]